MGITWIWNFFSGDVWGFVVMLGMDCGEMEGVMWME